MSCPPHARHTKSHHVVALTLSIFVALLTPGPSVSGPPADSTNYSKGWWSPPQYWRSRGIHLTLQKSTGNYAGQVLYWNRGLDAPDSGPARVWRFTHNQDLPTDTTQYVSYPSPLDIFCSGHSALSDGRLLVTGGTETYEGIGQFNDLIFTPATGVWDSLTTSNMAEPRWYPTNTTLGDGRVVTWSGLRWREALVFGGLDSTETVSGTTFALGLRSTPRLVDIDLDETESAVPPELEFHSAVMEESKQTTQFTQEGFQGAFRMLVFGGRDDTGSISGDLWQLKRQFDESCIWAEVTAFHTSSDGPPSARYHHSAVVQSGLGETAPDTMVIFGGLGGLSTPEALNDTWLLLCSSSDNAMDDGYRDRWIEAHPSEWCRHHASATGQSTTRFATG